MSIRLGILALFFNCTLPRIVLKLVDKHGSINSKAMAEQLNMPHPDIIGGHVYILYKWWDMYFVLALHLLLSSSFLVGVIKSLQCLDGVRKKIMV